MYVKNGKISNRQTMRLYVFDLMGIATLLLPPYLAKRCGVDGIFAVLIGTLLGLVYLFYLGWIMKHMQMDMNQFLKFQTRPVIRAGVQIFILLHSVFTAGFCGLIFADLMQYSLVQEASVLLVLAVIVVLSAYSVSGGIETRARIYEVLFWFVLIPYVAMMLASIKNFEPVYISKFFVVEAENFWKGIYLVFLFFTPLFFSLFLIGEKEKSYGKNVIKTVAFSVLIAGGILLGSYILLIGNFGEEALASMQYPVVTLMSTIQFKGNFLKRMDALMLAVWFFTLFALLNLHLHYGRCMVREIFSKGKEKVWQVLLTAVLVFGVAFMMYTDKEKIRLFFYYYSLIAVPFMVFAPVVVLWLRKEK